MRGNPEIPAHCSQSLVTRQIVKGLLNYVRVVEDNVVNQLRRTLQYFKIPSLKTPSSNKYSINLAYDL